jgi:hypothetical protein
MTRILKPNNCIPLTHRIEIFDIRIYVTNYVAEEGVLLLRQ